MNNNLMQAGNIFDLIRNEGAQTPLDIPSGAADITPAIMETFQIGSKILDVSGERDKRLDDSVLAAIQYFCILAGRPNLSEEQIRQISEGLVNMLTVQKEDAEAGRAHQRSILKTSFGGAIASGVLSFAGPALMRIVTSGLV